MGNHYIRLAEEYGERKISRDELRDADGKDGRPAYFAYKGKVYEVTKSVLWRNGTHVSVHFAGMDLTSEMEGAPHSEEMFDRVCPVGILEDVIPQLQEEGFIESLMVFYRRMHPHPISVHFPIALLVFAVLFLAGYIVTGEESFEVTSYYLLLGGTLTAVPGVVSGLLSWKISYMATLTTIFKRKIQLSAALIIVSVVCVAIRWLVPDVAAQGGILRICYIGLVFALAPIAMGLGYYGGKISFPS